MINTTTTDTQVQWITTSNGQTKSIAIIGDYRITITERRHTTNREYFAATRVYGAIEALVPEFVAEEPYQGISIPFKPESAVDKMRASVWNAWKRATTAEAANRLVMILDKLSGLEGIEVAESAIASVKFSQKAGCTSCPCSPGFVLGGHVCSDDQRGSYPVSRPVDMWIENWTEEAIAAAQA